MRSGYVVLPDDAGNAGKRHGAIADGSVPSVWTPRTADHTDLGALYGEYTLRKSYTSTTGQRYLMLLNPAGSNIAAEIAFLKWKIYAATAQAMIAWQGYTFKGVTGIGGDSEAGSIWSGRGESKGGRVCPVNLQSVAAGGSYTVWSTWNQFREAIAVTPATGIQREIEVVAAGMVKPVLYETHCLVLQMQPSPGAAQYEAEVTLSWREWAP